MTDVLAVQLLKRFGSWKPSASSGSRIGKRLQTLWYQERLM